MAGMNCGIGCEKLGEWGALIAAMPGDVAKMGVAGYAKEHPGVIAIAVFGVAAIAHVAYYGGIIPKKRR